jgi:hypothetical protein
MPYRAGFTGETIRGYTDTKPACADFKTALPPCSSRLCRKP